MTENTVDFPPEADNTQFNALPLMTIDEIREQFMAFVSRSDTDPFLPTSFDFTVENEWFVGRIRLHIMSRKHLTVEFGTHPTVFYLTGPVTLLDGNGSEVGGLLEAGGQLDVAVPRTGSPSGTLTIWRPSIEPHTDWLDAS